jgi:hypothetical protein
MRFAFVGWFDAEATTLRQAQGDAAESAGTAAAKAQSPRWRGSAPVAPVAAPSQAAAGRLGPARDDREAGVAVAGKALGRRDPLPARVPYLDAPDPGPGMALYDVAVSTSDVPGASTECEVRPPCAPRCMQARATPPPSPLGVIFLERQDNEE